MVDMSTMRSEGAGGHAAVGGGGAATCTAKAKSTGARCRRAPMAGAVVCEVHGGRAPQVKAAARRRVVEDKVRAMLGFSDDGKVTDPVEELRRVLGAQRRVAEAVAELVAREQGKPEPDPDELRALLQVWHNHTDRFARYLVELAKLGIDQQAINAVESVLSDGFAREWACVLDALAPYADARVAVARALSVLDSSGVA